MLYNIDTVLDLLINDKEVLTSELLKGQWKKINKDSGVHTTGHCYAASEALYYLCGGKSSFIPQMGKDTNGNTHWWLKRKDDDAIIDPTSSQFTLLNLTPPYHNGKGKGFMQQSDRSKIIMNRIIQKIITKEV